MAERRLVRSPAAEEDLIDIWVTIALDNRRAADKFHSELKSRMAQLVVFPESGPLRQEIAQDLRTLSCRNYLILYRIMPEDVDIVRIVHGARDFTTLF